LTWGPLAFHIPATVVALLAAGLLARRLDVLSLGEEDARRLGLDVFRTRVLVLITAAALTSLAVALAGVVAFAGLVVPHIARRFVGVRHTVLVPAAAIGGALFITVADTAARTAFVPHELPLGIVTSLIGAPVFLGILRATQRRESFL
jgi:iron complex transport system permease protein